ncbi:unnamed protein product, partial [Vitis vinifera]|uniref:Uncharacterized protein n=1 Tax=Vitis vinifera TaxID=29760 RepID=D7SUN9_VITVI
MVLELLHNRRISCGMIKILNCRLIWIVLWETVPLMIMSSLFYLMMIQK